MAAGFQQRRQPRLQGRDVGGQDPRLQLGKQLLRRQERIEFACREPQPRQFISRAAGRIGGEAVAARFPVPDDGGMEPVAQVFEVALEGGARNRQRFEEYLQRHHAPLVEKLVDLVEALGAVHGFLPDDWLVK